MSLRVAAAVARAAEAEGLARADVGDAAAQVRRAMWEPAYRVVRPLTSEKAGSRAGSRAQGVRPARWRVATGRREPLTPSDVLRLDADESEAGGQATDSVAERDRLEDSEAVRPVLLMRCGRCPSAPTRRRRPSREDHHGAPSR